VLQPKDASVSGCLSVQLSGARRLHKRDFCYLPSVCGNCKALFIRFFYNASSQRCEEFIYGGCGGNRNNFETKRECFQACSHAGNQPHRQGPPRAVGPLLPPGRLAPARHGCPGSAPPRWCYLLAQPSHGPCRGHFYRYAYNPATGTCRVFLYGGCRGNANNFETLKECQRACQRGERRALGWTGLDWSPPNTTVLPGIR
uniref:BPTI/Kunitz inhibitor domain-containing protein n=1 Tax=Anser brachyrhynchus TaxID=132585 RepID=A0A8B9BW92_9AVES